MFSTLECCAVATDVTTYVAQANPDRQKSCNVDLTISLPEQGIQTLDSKNSFHDVHVFYLQALRDTLPENRRKSNKNPYAMQPNAGTVESTLPGHWISPSRSVRLSGQTAS